MMPTQKRRKVQYDSEMRADWRYYGSDGSLKYGWQKICGQWYYFDTEWFYMYQDGIYEIGGKEYKFDSNGVLIE